MFHIRPVIPHFILWTVLAPFFLLELRALEQLQQTLALQEGLRVHIVMAEVTAQRHRSPARSRESSRLPRGIAIERRQFVGSRHPADALGHLNLSLRGGSARLVVRRALNVDDVRQDDRVRVEQAGPAVAAEVPPAVLG